LRNWNGEEFDLLQHLREVEGRVACDSVTSVKLKRAKAEKDSYLEWTNDRGVWWISRRGQLQIIEMLEGLNESADQGHQYLDIGDPTGIQIMCSKDEYPSKLPTLWETPVGFRRPAEIRREGGTSVIKLASGLKRISTVKCVFAIVGEFADGGEDGAVLELPPEFIELCKCDQVEPEVILRGFIADSGIMNWANNPPADGYSSNGSDNLLVSMAGGTSVPLLAVGRTKASRSSESTSA
jgi:hypothetical protein